MNYPTGTDEVSIPTEDTRNGRRMRDAVRRKAGTKTHPWAAEALYDTPPQPQDEAIPAAKKPRLETSMMTAADVGVSVPLPAHASPRVQVHRRWTVEEDSQLTDAVAEYGRDWVPVATHVPGRTQIQCRQRWIETLDPKLNRKRGRWTAEEDEKLIEGMRKYSRDWIKIAALVSSRTNNQCFHRWNDFVDPSKWQYSPPRARVIRVTPPASGPWTVQEEKNLVSAIATHGKQGPDGRRDWIRISECVQTRDTGQCRNKYLDMYRKPASCVWTKKEEKKLISAAAAYRGHSRRDWAEITSHVPMRDMVQCRNKWQHMRRNKSNKMQQISRKPAATSSGVSTVEEKMKLVPEQTTDAASVPETHVAVLSQLSDLEVSPDLHVFPRDSQKFLSLIGITTAQSLLEINVEELATSYVGWRDETVSLDDARATVREWKNKLDGAPTEPDGIHDDSFSGDADIPSGCNKAVGDVDDNMSGDETISDVYTDDDSVSGDTDLPSGCNNKAVEDVGDNVNMPIDETTSDVYTHDDSVCGDTDLPSGCNKAVEGDNMPIDKACDETSTDVYTRDDYVSGDTDIPSGCNKAVEGDNMPSDETTSDVYTHDDSVSGDTDLPSGCNKAVEGDDMPIDETKSDVYTHDDSVSGDTDLPSGCNKAVEGAADNIPIDETATDVYTHDDSVSGDTDIPSGCNKVVEDVGDNMHSDETKSDVFTHDDSVSGYSDLPSGCNKAVEGAGDNMPIDETATDGYTSGDEPPGKRRGFDWLSKYIPGWR
jgi:hypothetical protein